MPWNGSGVFNRIYSWVADKAAGLDISSTRMDTDTDDIATSGFGNCLTRDGQGQPTATLPMAGFRHTGVQNAVNRSDYSAFGQVQDGLPNWTIAGGSADALTATYTPALSVLADGQLCFLRAGAANATTTPTFAPNGLTPEVITRGGGSALVANDIPGNLAEIILRYNFANTRWELLNPSNQSVINASASTGFVTHYLGSTAPSGWLMFNDSTMGSASSGASSANVANLALFNLLFASPFTDTTCPLLTSTGSATTRAGQGSAAAAWAANCRMTLPLTLGRVLGVAGSGAGVTARVMGVGAGSDGVTLSTLNLPPYTPAGTNGTVTVTNNNGVQINTSGSLTPPGGGSSPVAVENTAGTLTSTGSGPTFTGSAQGGTSSSVSIVQPSQYFNVIVKL